MEGYRDEDETVEEVGLVENGELASGFERMTCG